MPSVYILTCLKNNKRFVGSTSSPSYWNDLKCMLVAGKSQIVELQKDWNDYGPDNFSFEFVLTRVPKNLLHKAKTRWVYEFRTEEPEFGYNTCRHKKNPSEI